MKKILLIATLFFISTRAFSIIFWQPYPITAVITSNGTQQRIECSVYDSLLGSWQYYNTPYYNGTVNTSGSSTPIIIFYAQDTIFGYIIYDQELHQFAPVFKSNGYPNHNSWVLARDAIVGIHSECCNDISTGEPNMWVEAYIYDIKIHAWHGGISWNAYGFDGGTANVYIETGGLVSTAYNDWTWDPDDEFYFYGPALDNFAVKVAVHG